jgi:hypothetical protein
VVTGPQTSALVGKTTDLPDGATGPTIDLDERTKRVTYARFYLLTLATVASS